VWAGGCNVFRPPHAPLVEFVLAQGVTCLDISRMHAADLAASPDAPRLHGIKLRTGGSAVPFGLRHALQQRVTRQLYVRYAASECGAISMALPDEHDADESSGRPLPGVELQVVGSDGHPLPSGESGEIRLRAPGMASGYIDDPAQSARRFRDGWFYPGDAGLLRGDGQLVVQGRSDDMIVLNGLNIFPAEIERVLERHAAVAEAAALPLASTVHGQIPVAAVVLRPGQGVSASELRRWSHQQLGLRAPRRVLVLDALPKNSQGKTVKKDLVQQFELKP
jgi:acyl-CoA synthetase (AMP-forming)/AMP-acid ligase II